MRNLSKQQRLENIQDNHDITRQIKQPETPPPPPKPPEAQKKN